MQCERVWNSVSLSVSVMFTESGMEYYDFFKAIKFLIKIVMKAKVLNFIKIIFITRAPQYSSMKFICVNECYEATNVCTILHCGF